MHDGLRLLAATESCRCSGGGANVRLNILAWRGELEGRALMREKIFGFFALVVVISSVLAFALMRVTLGDLSNKGEAERAVRSAVAELQVEGLRVERWLLRQASNKKLLEPFDAGTRETGLQLAREQADKLENLAKKESSLVPVSVVALFDNKGKVLSRNRSNLWAGRDLGSSIPGIVDTIKAGATGSDVLAEEQLLVSYAPIHNASGGVIGGLLVGTAFNDDRMENVSESTSKLPLVAAVPKGDAMAVVGISKGATAPMKADLGSAKEALDKNQVVGMRGLPDDFDGAARRLDGYGDGQRAAIIAVTQARNVGNFGSMVFPLLGVILLGLILTAVLAHFLDNYVSRPISDLEDGLLTIINGQHDIRFELEHW